MASDYTFHAGNKTIFAGTVCISFFHFYEEYEMNKQMLFLALSARWRQPPRRRPIPGSISGAVSGKPRFLILAPPTLTLNWLRWE